MTCGQNACKRNGQDHSLRVDLLLWEIMVNCEGAEMRIFLLKRPSILLESVEVLYAYVNEIPARDLAGGGKLLHPGT